MNDSGESPASRAEKREHINDEMQQLRQEFAQICQLIENEQYMKELAREYKSHAKEVTILNGNVNGVLQHTQLDSSIKSEVPSRRDSEEINEIGNSLEKVLRTLEKKLASESDLPGKFIPIGSTHSGTGLSKSADFDFIYQLDNIIQIKTTSDINRFELSDKCHKLICPQRIYEQFAASLKSHLGTLELPYSLEFGGFDNPAFSGVRYCEPAITVLLKWVKGDIQEIPVDITPAFLLPDSSTKTVKRVVAQLESLGINEKAIKHLKVASQLHLIPLQPEHGKWNLTTAVLETELLKYFEGCSVKQAIILCKKTTKCLTNAILEHCQGDLDDAEVLKVEGWLTNAISCYKRQRAANKLDAIELRDILQDILSWVHIFLSLDKGKELCEYTVKHPVAINSCSIKFNLLNQLKDYPDRNCKELVDQALEAILVGNGLTDHTFLDYQISQYTVACYCAKQKQKLCGTAKAILHYMIKSQLV